MTNTQIPDVLEWLQQMVRIPSVHPSIGQDTPLNSEQQLAEWIEKKLYELGIGWMRLPVSDNRGFQILARVQGSIPGAPSLLFDSHLDTVGTAGMTIDPHGGDIIGNRLYGRGACDTKGTGAALIGALRAYKAETYRPHDVLALFSIGEEAGMDGIQHFCATTLAKARMKPVLAIVGEPTEMAIIAAHQGAGLAHITLHGKACHSSTPHAGINSIEKLDIFMQALRDYQATLPENPLTGPASCSATLIKGGESSNIIPDTTTITLSRRIAPQEDYTTWQQDLETHFSRVFAKCCPEITLSFEFPDSMPPLSPQLPENVLKHVHQTLKEAGFKWPILSASYCTNASHLSAHKIPSIVCGPGNMHQAHTKDEWVDTQEILKGVDGYLSLMQMKPISEISNNAD